MADKELPFNDDIMTMIMGVSPDEPGQHGRTKAPMPTDDAVSLITDIRDMCDEWLQKAGKGTEEKSEKGEDKKEDDTDELL